MPEALVACRSRPSRRTPVSPRCPGWVRQPRPWRLPSGAGAGAGNRAGRAVAEVERRRPEHGLTNPCLGSVLRAEGARGDAGKQSHRVLRLPRGSAPRAVCACLCAVGTARHGCPVAHRERAAGTAAPALPGALPWWLGSVGRKDGMGGNEFWFSVLAGC